MPLVCVQRTAKPPEIVRIGRAGDASAQCRSLKASTWSSTWTIHAAATGPQRSPTSAPSSSSRQRREATSTRSSVESRRRRSRQIVELLSPARPYRGGLPQPQGRSRRQADLPSAGRPCRSPHLHRLPGLLPARHARPTAGGFRPGLTPRSVLEKFSAVQMIDVHIPTTDGREIQFTRHTEPQAELRLLLDKLKLELPPQPSPRITSLQT